MWDQVKNLIGKSAPLIGSLLGGPAGASVGTLIANTLGVEDDEKAVFNELTNNPEALGKIIMLQNTHKERMEELSISQMQIESNERIVSLGEQHKTNRAEINSGDKFISRWRPTFGYAVCLSWVLIFAAIFICTIKNPKETAALITAFVALTPLFSIALAVLGVNIHQRSKDKMCAAGFEPKPLINMFNKK